MKIDEIPFVQRQQILHFNLCIKYCHQASQILLSNFLRIAGLKEQIHSNSNTWFMNEWRSLSDRYPVVDEELVWRVWTSCNVRIGINDCGFDVWKALCYTSSTYRKLIDKYNIVKLLTDVMCIYTVVRRNFPIYSKYNREIWPDDRVHNPVEDKKAISMLHKQTITWFLKHVYLVVLRHRRNGFFLFAIDVT